MQQGGQTVCGFRLSGLPACGLPACRFEWRRCRVSPLSSQAVLTIFGDEGSLVMEAHPVRSHERHVGWCLICEICQQAAERVETRQDASGMAKWGEDAQLTPLIGFHPSFGFTSLPSTGSAGDLYREGSVPGAAGLS